MKKNYLVSFDVSDDKARRKVVRILEDYGIRWQYSVFHCSFSEAEYKKAIAGLNKYLGKEDSVCSISLTQQTMEQSDFLGALAVRLAKKPEINIF